MSKQSERRDLTERGQAIRLLAGEAMQECARIEGVDGRRMYAVSADQLASFISRAWTMAHLRGESSAWRQAIARVRGR